MRASRRTIITREEIHMATTTERIIGEPVLERFLRMRGIAVDHCYSCHAEKKLPQTLYPRPNLEAHVCCGMIDAWGDYAEQQGGEDESRER